MFLMDFKKFGFGHWGICVTAGGLHGRGDFFRHGRQPMLHFLRHELPNATALKLQKHGRIIDDSRRKANGLVCCRFINEAAGADYATGCWFVWSAAIWSQSHLIFAVNIYFCLPVNIWRMLVACTALRLISTTWLSRKENRRLHEKALKQRCTVALIPCHMLVCMRC